MDKTLTSLLHTLERAVDRATQFGDLFNELGGREQNRPQFLSLIENVLRDENIKAHIDKNPQIKVRFQNTLQRAGWVGKLR
ncbi:MAG: hypothetical protein EOP04_09415 [Proteobacteria bacterium]|nr:MAG: hypothetical protein EOP04_09415 [Pseudomonadota bacterium]